MESDVTKDELVERARELGVEHPTQFKKDELATEVARAEERAALAAVPGAATIEDAEHAAEAPAPMAADLTELGSDPDRPSAADVAAAEYARTDPAQHKA